MDVPVRTAFDVSLPFVASQPFAVGEQSFVDGDPVDWKALGISEIDLHCWWSSGLVRCVNEPAVDRTAKLTEPMPFAATREPANKRKR